MTFEILKGDCRDVLPTLPAGSVHCIVTSPPYYGLRDYGVSGQIGLEQTPDAYVAEMVAVFREAKRVLRDDGTLWLNIGDSYSPSKQLHMIPACVALALQADGWYLRSEIIWAKPNPMPESVTDRPTSAHEKVYLFAKRARYYYYDAATVREPFADARQGNPGAYNRTTSAAKGQNNDRQDGGFLNNGGGWNADGSASGRNIRNVWTIAPKPYKGAHFATMPPALAEICIKAGCPVGGTVLDPFGGAGTTGLVANYLGRNAVLIELNSEYTKLAEERLGLEHEPSKAKRETPKVIDVSQMTLAL